MIKGSKTHGRSTWRNCWMKRINGTIRYRLGFRKDQQIASGLLKCTAVLKKMKRYKDLGLLGPAEEMIQATGEIGTQ